MPVINISLEASEKFRKIRESRPQDAKAAQTFDHILYVYEEQQFKHPSKIIVQGESMRIIPHKVSSPIIDAEKQQAEKKP